MMKQQPCSGSRNCSQLGYFSSCSRYFFLFILSCCGISKVVSAFSTTTTTTTVVRRPNTFNRFPRSDGGSQLRAVQEATFGMGCFWEPSESLLKVDGVLETLVGYTGNPKFDEQRQKKIQMELNNSQSGDDDNRLNDKQSTTMMVPSYESVCASRDWVEGVRVKFNDEEISYMELLDVMFDQHKAQLGSRQYGSIIFPQTPSQATDAQTWYDQMVAKDMTRPNDGWKVEWTTIEPSSNFYQAEGYHQNYWQKQRPRFAVIGLLLVLSTVGIPGGVLDDALNHQIETVANSVTIAICLFIAAERWFDAKVIELS